VDDIRHREICLYGPTQAMKTVVLEIVIAYLLDMRRKSVLAVAQTDDDSKSFSQIKLAPILERIPSLENTVKSGRSGKTVSQWLWSAHELIISGPGENAQESKSVSALVTDEAHRWNVAYPGAMAALRNRLGLRWDRLEFHATTAAEVGTEIDIDYHAGQQDEWHIRCLGCNGLIWPLWTEASRAHYNGHEVFQWKESQSETETLDSIVLVCPHCGLDHEDNAHNRVDMDLGADYVTMNPTADASIRSYRWNAFAPRWKAWRDLLAIYKKAIHSAKLGDLAPYRDWVTKQCVESWENQYPMLGDSTLGRDYSLADIQPDPTKLRFVSIDVQDGKGGDVFHLWIQIDEFERNGDSRRIAYERCATWEDARARQSFFGVADKCVGVDCGDRAREVFAYCAKFHWLALKSGDEEGFAHPIVNPVTHVVTHVSLPYSTTRLESATVGKETQKDIRLPRGGKAPAGFANLVVCAVLGDDGGVVWCVGHGNS